MGMDEAKAGVPVEKVLAPKETATAVPGETTTPESRSTNAMLYETPTNVELGDTTVAPDGTTTGAPEEKTALAPD